MSDLRDISNTTMRKIIINNTETPKCREPNCDIVVNRPGSRCAAHRKERPYLRKKLSSLNIDKFKLSKLVCEIEQQQREEGL